MWKRNWVSYLSLFKLLPMNKASKERQGAWSVLLMCVARTKFGKLLEDNDYLCGIDKFPIYLNDAYHCVTNWSNGPRNVMNIIRMTNDGLTHKRRPPETKHRSNQGTCQPSNYTLFCVPWASSQIKECPKTPEANTPNETEVNNVQIERDLSCPTRMMTEIWSTFLTKDFCKGTVLKETNPFYTIRMADFKCLINLIMVCTLLI